MSRGTTAVFVMPQEGHFHGLRPLVSDLAAHRLKPHVFTDSRFAAHVEAADGTFVDLFARYPLERADQESFPDPCRFVTYAGLYADAIVDELEDIRPSLIVYDQHAVIGRVVAARLGIPYVCVCPAHNVSEAQLPRLLATLPRIHISARCEAAVARLRDHHGIEDASPFLFASGLSPHLNLYGEPPDYLTEAERRALAPTAFYGCLPPTAEIKATPSVAAESYFPDGDGRLRVYVSFGTVIWRYWPAEALDALSVISEALGARDDVAAVLSLGGVEIGAEAKAALARPNVSVASRVDQWRLLAEADAFITHNGLKSTHESIFHRVPMISCPFLWDQPALAERCQRLGLAIALASSAPARIRPRDVDAALDELRQRSEAMGASLAEARERELEVMRNRGAVVERIAGLIAG